MRNVCKALLVICLSPIAFASELVVLESTSPDYQAGEILDSEIQIVLDEDGDVTLIAEDGTFIHLTGPFVGVPSLDEIQDASGVLDALGRLVGSAESTAVDIGGVRGDEDRDDFLAQEVDDTRTSPWTLHTDITGAQCVIADAQEVMYWRENSGSSEELQVKHIASGNNVSVEWKAGDNTVTWPGALTLVADEMYLLRLGDELQSTTLLVREIPAAVNNEGAAIVAFLAAKGCIAQAKMEFDRLRPAI